MTNFSIMTALNPKAPVNNVIKLAQATEALGFPTTNVAVRDWEIECRE